MIARIAAECRRAPEGPPLLLLLPEQSSYQTERELVARCGAYVRARVVSFSRLLEFVYAEQPAPMLPRVTPTHRRMLVTRIVLRNRAAGTDPLFAIDGIEESLAQFVSEAFSYAASPERIRSAAAAAAIPGLASKLRVLAGFLEEYRGALADRFQEPQEAQFELARAIATSELLQSAEVFVDGFHGFTPVEERVLSALLQRSARVHLALTLEPARARQILAGDPLRPHPVFSYPEEALQRVAALARDAAVPIEPLRLYEDLPRFAGAPALAHLSRNFLQRRATPLDQAAPEIALHELPTPRDEARYAAEIAARWIRTEGVDPGGIAILTGALAEDAVLLREELDALRVPCFIDRAEPLEMHPLVQGLSAALRVLRHGWQADDVIDTAKAGLLPLERREAEKLATACAARPPHPGEWLTDAPWPPLPSRSFFEDEGPEESHATTDLDAIRRSAVAPLAQFAANTQPDADGLLRFARILDAMEPLVDAWIARTGAEDDERERPILERLGELLNTAAEALGEERLTLDEACQQAASLLGDLTLPRIPPLIGQVLVGDIDRSRPPMDLRRAILLGWSAGSIPRSHRTMSILNDRERDELLGLQLELVPSAKRAQEREAYLGYLALTRAAERVAILRSFARGGSEPIAPSPYWQEVSRLLPTVAPLPVSPRDSLPRAMRPREVAAIAIRERTKLHELPASDVPIPSGLRQLLGSRSNTRRILHAAEDRNRAQLSPEVLREVYEGRWRSSVSALESFARCPFQHFVRAMLRPEEPLPPEADARDAGNLAHAILRAYTEELIRDRIGFGDVLDSQLAARIEHAIEGPRRRAERSGVFRSGAGTLLFDATAELAERTIRWLTVAHAVFASKPAAAELGFGNGERPALKLELDNGWAAELRGQIDRHDAVETAAGVGTLVVDYKLGAHAAFDLTSWDLGEKLQLPAYLIALSQQEPERRPIAAFNITFALAPKDEEAWRAGRPERIRARGIARTAFYEPVGGEDFAWARVPFFQGAATDPAANPTWGSAYSEADFQRLLEETRLRMAKLAQRIVEGDATVRPLQTAAGLPCEHCTVRPVCRIDFAWNSPHRPATRRRAEIVGEWRGNGDAAP